MVKLMVQLSLSRFICHKKLQQCTDMDCLGTRKTPLNTVFCCSQAGTWVRFPSPAPTKMAPFGAFYVGIVVEESNASGTYSVQKRASDTFLARRRDSDRKGAVPFPSPAPRRSKVSFTPPLPHDTKASYLGLYGICLCLLKHYHQKRLPNLRWQPKRIPSIIYPSILLESLDRFLSIIIMAMKNTSANTIQITEYNVLFSGDSTLPCILYSS